ncbi:MAG: CPXCG motif-containing cysteine-rich protein [Bacteroidetes bacterium]|nr:CPXCG motif-containing cysteine-rich protein [Bacteroidota bacterium]
MNRHKQKVEAATYRCAYCGEAISTFVDPFQGNRQTYIEDCQVCCKPNQLTVYYDEWSESYQIRSDPSE